MCVFTVVSLMKSSLPISAFESPRAIRRKTCCYKEHQGGTAQIRGTETFVGCVNPIGDCNNSATTYGTFDTTFTFTAKFDGRPPDVTLYQEVHGRCQHPIGGGTGVFAGATGVLTFKDDVTNGTAPYKGHITLQ